MLSQKGICGFIFALCCTGVFMASISPPQSLRVLSYFANKLLETFERETHSINSHLENSSFFSKLILPECSNMTSWDETGNWKILKVFESILKVLGNTTHPSLLENTTGFIKRNLNQLDGYLKEKPYEANITERFDWKKIEDEEDDLNEKMALYCILMTYRNCINSMTERTQSVLFKNCSTRKNVNDYWYNSSVQVQEP